MMAELFVRTDGRTTLTPRDKAHAEGIMRRAGWDGTPYSVDPMELLQNRPLRITFKLKVDAPKEDL